MQKMTRLIVGLLTLAVSQVTFAARQLGPPIEELQSTPDRIRIVAAVATEKDESSRIRFAVDERFSGESPDDVLLRTDKETFTDIVVGGSYLVAWTNMRRNRRVIGGWEKDPDGPSTVKIQGLGSTALFEDTPEIRFLFDPDTHADPQTAGQQIDALLAVMQREDSRGRSLVITELYLRPDLTEKMDRSQGEVLKVVVQKQALDPQQRDFLLRSALRLPQDLTSHWLGEEFRKIIIQHGTQYDLRSFVPGLVRTAARGLQQAGESTDIELLSNLLYANNPGVAKAALGTMDHFDPEATIDKAEQAIERGWLHDETGFALQRYLKQIR